ncbi:DUF302 domain-containing protein [Sulfurospirillum sp. 1612]|uniref:DUF302 domain-containing protein n=1 Tax=Sulfurospirillum sp. 1612 TaxID=3094835 RepID=UPI002F94EB1E
MQFLFGLVLGFVLCAVVVWKFMPKLMMINKRSKLNFEETVEAIQKLAKEAGWNVPHVYNMKQSFEKAGNKNVEKMHVISLGQSKHAYEIVKHDKDKNILAFMPYRAGVYEDTNGKVYFCGANMTIMSKLFGGNIEKVMGASAKELDDAFAKILL